ncbi:sulfotransferase family protein [Streptomyces fractus]|uniref:sulfotransferase family protein n=1 Tax=Streptomyces fractus TaxID=641806 RepID=UPI003CEC8E50
MRDDRWGAVRKGLRRRRRLLGEAIRPPAPRARALDAVPAQPGPADDGHADDGPDGGPVVEAAPRLVPDPVFLLSSVRSGSTLLRVLLNSHPRIRAPHEMHLRTLHVRLDRDFTYDAMGELGLDRRELEHMLWDRVLHHARCRGGVEETELPVVVDKTPANTLLWRRLHRAWPQARYVFLLRHPAAVVESLTARRTEPDIDAIHQEVLGYAEELEHARHTLDGVTLTYEDLTAEPERETRRICAHLGVDWDPAMLDYGARDHGTFRPHIGDWSETIRSGRIQPARMPATCDGLPPRLRELARAWGYEVWPAGPG